MSLKAFKSSQPGYYCRWIGAVAAITIGSGLACAPNESRQQLPPQASGGHAPSAQEHAGGNASSDRGFSKEINDSSQPADRTTTKVSDSADEPNGGNKTATGEFQLDAKLLSNDKSPEVEIVFTNSSRSEVGIFLGRSIDGIYIDVFNEDGKRIPQRIVPGRRRPRSSDDTQGAFSGSTAFLKPTETLKWKVDLGEYFDLPKGKCRVFAKTNVTVIGDDGKASEMFAESDPVELVIK